MEIMKTIGMDEIPFSYFGCIDLARHVFFFFFKKANPPYLSLAEAHRQAIKRTRFLYVFFF